MNVAPAAKRRGIGLIVVDTIVLTWRASRWMMCGPLLLTSAQSGILALQLLVAGHLLDTVTRGAIGPPPAAQLAPWILAAALLFGGDTLVNAVLREREFILGETVGRFVERHVLHISTEVELSAFDDPDFHDRLKRVDMGTSQPVILLQNAFSLLSSAVTALGAMAALFLINPWLGAAILPIAVPAGLLSSKRGREFFDFLYGFTPRDREREYLGSVLRSRELAKEIRAFQLGSFLLGRHQRMHRERLDELHRFARRHIARAVAAAGAAAACVGISLSLVTWLSARRELSLTEAALAIAALAVLSVKLSQVGRAAGMLKESSLYLTDYAEFARLPVPLASRREAAPSASGFAEIVVDQVSFGYPGSGRVLREISMRIPAGGVVAVVGENGSGKTTLVKLLCGLYEPSTGSLAWLDAHGAKAAPSVSVLFQDFGQYLVSARDNIGFGDSASMDDGDAIRRAARAAGADGVIDRLPAGYDTILGPEFIGGTDLSRGQWQRLALGRTLFRRSSLVILDEPAAALDPRREYELFANLRASLGGRTALIISHRFSNVRHADRIYVLKQGRIVEEGSHLDLMRQAGMYAELFTMQAKGYRDVGAPADHTAVGGP